jgi:hypothetical protein
MQNYTLNGWRRCKTTLETGGEVVKLHSKRVEKMQNYTQNKCFFSGSMIPEFLCHEDRSIVFGKSSKVQKKLKRESEKALDKLKRLEGLTVSSVVLASSPLVSSVVAHLLHSFRV